MEESNENKEIRRPRYAEAYYKKNTYYKRISIIKKILSHIILIIVGVYSIFPIYYVILISLSSVNSIAETSLSDLLPKFFSLSNYYLILFKYPFLTWLGNTLIFCTASTAIGIAFAIIAGIGMSRFNIPGKKAILYMMLILTMFPFVVMVIPLYFMFATLHLVDTYQGLILAYTGGALVYSSWLIMNYVNSLPRDYEEAAQLDGLTQSQALFRILVPMSRPVIIFATLVAFMGPYTDYALAGQFITTPSMYTLAIGLYYTSTGTVVMNYNVYAAFSVLMGLPLFILFFVFQKYLVTGFSLATYK